MGTLGLSERKAVPDPVVFEETDPLGISLMAAPHNSLMAFTGLGKRLDAWLLQDLVAVALNV